MDKELNWLADVILGSSNEIALPAREVPDLPLDDPLFKARRGDSIPRTSAIDDLCAKLDLDTLVSTLCPILTEAQIEADVERFSPTPKLESGFDALLKEILPSVAGMAQLTPQTSAKFLDTFTKRAQPSRRKRINDRLDKKLYRHELMDRWNQMLVAFDNPMDAALPDDALFAKAQRFLEVA